MDCIYIAQFFVTSGHPKRFTISPQILPFIHTFTHRRWCQPRKVPASSSGAVRVRCLAHGYLDTQLGGAGDRTSNRAVTSQPALPPELLPRGCLTFFALHRTKYKLMGAMRWERYRVDSQFFSNWAQGMCLDDVASYKEEHGHLLDPTHKLFSNKWVLSDEPGHKGSRQTTKAPSV